MLSSADCEVRTITLPLVNFLGHRVPAFCHGQLGVVQHGCHHCIVEVESGTVIYDAYLHTLEDACAAMGDIPLSINLKRASVYEQEQLLIIFLHHDVCLPRFLRSLSLIEVRHGRG